jgi:hypothetical protein
MILVTYISGISPAINFIYDIAQELAKIQHYSLLSL